MHLRSRAHSDALQAVAQPLGTSGGVLAMFQAFTQIIHIGHMGKFLHASHEVTFLTQQSSQGFDCSAAV